MTDLALRDLREFATAAIPIWQRYDPKSTSTDRLFYDRHFEETIAENTISRSAAAKHHLVGGAGWLAERALVFRSGGTAKTFSYYLYDRPAWEAFVHDFDLHLASCGAENHCKVAFLGSGDPRHTLPRLQCSTRFAQSRYFALQTPLDEFADTITAYAPDVISGYGSLVDLLVRLHRAGRIRVAPKGIQVHTDALSRDGVDYIARHWGIHARQLVSTTELGVLATECANGALHLNTASVAVDWMADCTVFTNLRNRLQPILNFDAGGAFQLDERTCACGSRSPVLRMSGARRHPVLDLRTMVGAMVPMHALVLRSAVDADPSVEGFAVSQSDTQIAVTVTGNCTAEETEQRLKNAMRAYCSNADVSTLQVEVICPG